jgi:hypothetical protein
VVCAGTAHTTPPIIEMIPHDREKWPSPIFQ